MNAGFECHKGQFRFICSKKNFKAANSVTLTTQNTTGKSLILNNQDSINRFTKTTGNKGGVCVTMTFLFSLLQLFAVSEIPFYLLEDLSAKME